MAEFWCWLFGHRWHMVSDWLLANMDYAWAYFCTRCGRTATPINKVMKKEGE